MPRNSNNRKNIGNKKRFEIFKRDQFTCQYCGRRPPQIILQIDHVIAVADGGTNHEANLVCSCDECNNGKGATPLSQLPASRVASLERRREQAQQLKMLNDFLLEQRSWEDEVIDRLGRYWHNLDHKFNMTFIDQEVETVRRFVQQLPENDIQYAIASTKAKFKCISGYSRTKDDSFRYFCAICWRMIRDNQKGKPDHA